MNEPFQKLFRHVEPGQAFTYRGRELRRLGNGQWASDVRGNLWMMKAGDWVEVGSVPASSHWYQADPEEEDEMLDPFNVFP